MVALLSTVIAAAALICFIGKAETNKNETPEDLAIETTNVCTFWGSLTIMISGIFMVATATGL